MTKIKCPVCEYTNESTRKDCAHCGAPLPKVRVHSGPKPGDAPQPHAQGAAQSTFRKGQVVANRYTILDLVGKGGMGCIYLVTDNTLKEQVALKTLLPQYLRDKMVVERFFNEARIARQLSHPNIVRVHDIGMADQVLYISMEYLHGKSLRNMLDELLPGERLPVKETVRIMIDLCSALEYAHQYTVHRDLKPENIMVLPDGALKLMDFGISKLMTSNKLTATAVVMGTPHYMPPEQFKDSSTVDARADIYSIGVILYEILTGNLPTGVSKPASQILRDVPPALDPIIAKCVEPEPSQRYENVTQLKQALSGVADILRGGTLEAKQAPKTARAANGDLARRVAGGALIAVVLALTAIGVYGLDKNRDKDIAAAATTITSDPDAAKKAQWHNQYKDASELIAMAERRTANFEKSTGPIKDIFDCIDRLRGAAEKLEQANPERATKLALQVLQCYAAVMEPMPEDSYFFVLPGDVGEDGFFMARHPVALGDFAAWSNNTNWGAMQEPADPAQPVGTYAFYNAQAYAASQGMRVPSRSEWQRAYDAQANVLVTEAVEWTRDGSSGEAAPPTFGNEMVTVTVATDGDGNPVPPAFGSAPYSANQSIGFRCAVPISTERERLLNLFAS